MGAEFILAKKGLYLFDLKRLTVHVPYMYKYKLSLPP